ncbi:hypothetical protein OAH03_07165, partial [Akkermansiaceae bacterium]|nr:hypothetical protein [Akkermansiaceae bacterium]
MKTLIPQLALLLFLSMLTHADQAIDLEAKLKETTESSSSGGKLMEELVDLYWKDEKIFGIIRTTSKFSRAQTENPKRAAMTLKLVEGYTVTARHDDVIMTGRQFLKIFPGHALTNRVREYIATAYENTGRGNLAAIQYQTIWENGGSSNQGVKALRLFNQVNNGASFNRASSLAAAMAAKIPATSLLTGVGFQGMHAAERAEQWAEGLQIAKTLIRRNAPMNEIKRQDLWFRTGQFESKLGQFENAIQSYRQALKSKRADVHSSLVNAMISAKKLPSAIESEAKKYLAAFPKRDDRYSPLVKAANAAAEAKDLTRALTIAESVMQHDVSIQNLPQSYVKWCGENSSLAARGLLKLIAGNPKGIGTLRAVLALSVYRDGLKDIGKARSVAYDFLAKSPTEDKWTEEIIAFLYSSATGPETFRKDLVAISSSAKSFPHLAEFQDRIWKNAPQDKEQNRSWQKAKKSHQNDPLVNLWKDIQEKGGKSGKSCQQLLQQKLTKEQRHLVLSRLAYVYRHHLGGKSKESAAKYYQNLCQEFPKDLAASEQWLEAAA